VLNEEVPVTCICLIGTMDKRPMIFIKDKKGNSIMIMTTMFQFKKESQFASFKGLGAKTN
jgi:hypothetical protein